MRWPWTSSPADVMWHAPRLLGRCRDARAAAAWKLDLPPKQRQAPAMTVRIVYETHSTSEDNEHGIATGWLGGTLSVTGRRQARSLGDRRRNDDIGVVIASDLNRAVETADIAFGGSGIPILLDWRLRECNYGAMNGMPRVQLDRERRSRLDVPFPEGESWRQAVKRVASFLDELTRTRDGQRVLLIGHVATRWALDHQIHDVQLERLLEAPFTWQEGWEYVLATPPT
jgi:2,3-bisphosphoglycerate-dependent phosphoglycerate mutase